MTNSAPKYLTLCINYHNDEGSSLFIHDLLSQNDAVDQRIIVVDNSTRPRLNGPLSTFEREDLRVSVVRPAKNLGYFGGAAWGLKHYREKAKLAEWTIVCNTDIYLPQKDFLFKLNLLHGGSHASAVVAPAIISSISGRDQNPHMKSRPTRIRMQFYKWTYRLPPLFWLYRSLSSLKKVLFRWLLSSEFTEAFPDGSIAIYSPHGAFIAFNRRYFEAGGTLDHGVFLFGEEIFVAETCRRIGLSVQYDRRLRIVHREHEATGHYSESGKYQTAAAAHCADIYFGKTRK